MIRIQEVSQPEEYQPLDLSGLAPFTQAYFYGQWQEKIGRSVRRFLILKEGSIIGCGQAIKFPLAFGKHYWYLPYGPLLIEPLSPELLAVLKNFFMTLLLETDAVFIRFDFSPPLALNLQLLLGSHFSRAPQASYQGAHYQPRTEWVVDLTGTEEVLLQKMDRDTRYEIRYAQKRGLVTEVSRDFAKYFDHFYQLLKMTSERNGFHLHPKAYYENIFKGPPPTPASFLLITRVGGEISTINYILVHGQQAYYLFGTSSNNRRQARPAHLAQWAGMVEAKKQGCTEYNMGGITAGSLYRGLAGVTTFKKQFPGHEFAHSPFFDLVRSPLWYYIYCLRKLTKKLYAK